MPRGPLFIGKKSVTSLFLSLDLVPVLFFSDFWKSGPFFVLVFMLVFVSTCSCEGTLGKEWKRASSLRHEKTWLLLNLTIRYHCNQVSSGIIVIFPTIMLIAMIWNFLFHWFYDFDFRRLDWMTVEERVMTNIIIEKRDIAHACTHNKTRSSY